MKNNGTGFNKRRNRASILRATTTMLDQIHITSQEPDNNVEQIFEVQNSRMRLKLDYQKRKNLLIDMSNRYAPKTNIKL